ncbi:MAG TPA: cistern family PEP-CTERM protein [Novosphingobium sp.]|nr:cistern family PEP-CTERM protein [Novosphingobium sp.]
MLARTFMPLTALAALALSAAPAQADVITLGSGSVGQSYTFNFDGFSGSTTIQGLTSLATFTLTAITGNSYTFNYSLTNTTSSPLTSRLSGFGFNTNPDITSASSTGAFSYTTVGGSYPNGIGAIDVCFKDAKTGSCSGGGSGGLTTGTTGTGSFTLNFSQPVTSLSLSDFYVRYQSITGAGNITSASGSGTLTGTSGGISTSTSSGGTAVPEPGMLGLFGAALVGLAAMRRRRVPAKA